MYIADIVVRAIACANSTIPQERRGKGGGRSAENKREMYGRKDLICSCRVCFRLGVGGGGEGMGEINIHKRPERSRGRGQLTCIFRH